MYITDVLHTRKDTASQNTKIYLLAYIHGVIMGNIINWNCIVFLLIIILIKCSRHLKKVSENTAP